MPKGLLPQKGDMTTRQVDQLDLLHWRRFQQAKQSCIRGGVLFSLEEHGVTQLRSFFSAYFDIDYDEDFWPREREKMPEREKMREREKMKALSAWREMVKHEQITGPANNELLRVFAYLEPSYQTQVRSLFKRVERDAGRSEIQEAKILQGAMNQCNLVHRSYIPAADTMCQTYSDHMLCDMVNLLNKLDCYKNFGLTAEVLNIIFASSEYRICSQTPSLKSSSQTVLFSDSPPSSTNSSPSSRSRSVSSSVTTTSVSEFEEPEVVPGSTSPLNSVQSSSSPLPVKAPGAQTNDRYYNRFHTLFEMFKRVDDESRSLEKMGVTAAKLNLIP